MQTRPFRSQIHYNFGQCSRSRHLGINVPCLQNGVQIINSQHFMWWPNTALLVPQFKSILISFAHFMEQNPSWEANRLSASEEIPAFYGTGMFITAFTSSHHLSLSWASSIKSIPSHPNSWRSILILSPHISLGIPSALFPSGFPPKKPCIHLYSPHTC